MHQAIHGTIARGLIVSVSLGLWGAAGALAVDGTIHFTGVIVAAPHEMRVSMPASMTAHRAGTHLEADVVFVRQTLDRPLASVGVQALGAMPLAVVFTDAGGRAHPIAAGGDREVVGRDGGTLSIRIKGAPAPGHMTGALLTLTYF